MRAASLPADRYFGPDPSPHEFARPRYGAVAGRPLLGPRGHLESRRFADPDSSFGTPPELLILPDHYVFWRPDSPGGSLETTGIPRRAGGHVERDHRTMWPMFAANFDLEDVAQMARDCADGLARRAYTLES